MKKREISVSLGGWYQRTTLHLTEVYDLFFKGSSYLALSKDKLKPLENKEEKIFLSEDEKKVLTLINNIQKSQAVDYIKRYLFFSEQKINEIINKLYEKELIEISKENQNGILIEKYFHTRKVNPNLLNDNIRFRKDMGWSFK